MIWIWESRKRKSHKQEWCYWIKRSVLINWVSVGGNIVRLNLFSWSTEMSVTNMRWCYTSGLICRAVCLLITTTLLERVSRPYTIFAWSEGASVARCFSLRSGKKRFNPCGESGYVHYCAGCLGKCFGTLFSGELKAWRPMLERVRRHTREIGGDSRKVVNWECRKILETPVSRRGHIWRRTAG